LKIFQIFFLYSVQGVRCGNRRKFHADRRIFKHCKKSAKMSDGFPTRRRERVNEICLEGLIGEGYTLQVKHHVNVNKPWRVMNEFIHPQKNFLTFPIITKKLQEIQAGETLFHVQSTSFKDVLNILKGNPIKKIDNDIKN
jgi:hypothetical protein